VTIKSKLKAMKNWKFNGLVINAIWQELCSVSRQFLHFAMPLADS